MLRLRREIPGQFHHAGGAGSVVVGARVDLPVSRGRQRMNCSPKPKMIVVRADDDVFVGLPGR